jgi:hypothetical protein
MTHDNNPPKFKAVFIPQTPGEHKHGTLDYWCPYCECVHAHGAAGAGAEPRIEHRGAHCLHDESPLASKGISLEVAPRGPKASVYPPALIDLEHRNPTPRLRTNLEAGGPGIRRAALRALLIDTEPFRKAGKWRVWHAPDVRHFGIDGADLEGRGAWDLADLASQIFGVPREIAARRMLEACLGRRLSADQALAVEAALRGDASR